MELFHTTYQEIDKIHNNGKFGSALFFASNDVHYGNITYSIYIEESEIIDASSLFYQDNTNIICADIIQEIQELCNCEEQLAMNYLDESNSYNVCDQESAEISWEIQRLIFQCAKKLGYKGVKVKDEYGSSYLIDMLNRENELSRAQ